MESEVIQLKKKVKSLEQELCERTRNYLYHFKRSPSKSLTPTKILNTVEISIQTDITWVQDSRPIQHSLMDKQQDLQIQTNSFKPITLNFEAVDDSKRETQGAIKAPSRSERISEKSELQSDTKQNMDWNSEIFDRELIQKNEQHITEINNLTSEIRSIKENLERSNSPYRVNSVKGSPVKSDKSDHQVRSAIKTYNPNSVVDQERGESESIENIKSNLFQSLQEGKINGEDQKVKVNSSNLYESLPTPKQSLSSSKVSNRTDTIKEEITEEHMKEEIKILKNQIFKLKDHLDYEIKLGSYTKEGLLISEEQNYKFRLQIQNLKKQLQIKIAEQEQTSSQKALAEVGQEDNLHKSGISSNSDQTKQELEKFKNQNDHYQELVNHLEGVKAEYLNKCIQAKEQIHKLKEENQNMKIQIHQLNALLAINEAKLAQKAVSQNQAQEGSPGKNQSPIKENRLKIEEGMIEIFKNHIYEISNCLPLTKAEQQEFVFKPQTFEEVISMLNRIFEFCKQISSWERQKIKLIERERSNLLKIVSQILMKYPSTKDFIAEKIKEIDELKHLVNFLNRDSRRSSICSQSKVIAGSEQDSAA